MPPRARTNDCVHILSANHHGPVKISDDRRSLYRVLKHSGLMTYFDSNNVTCLKIIFILLYCFPLWFYIFNLLSFHYNLINNFLIMACGRRRACSCTTSYLLMGAQHTLRAGIVHVDRELFHQIIFFNRTGRFCFNKTLMQYTFQSRSSHVHESDYIW